MKQMSMYCRDFLQMLQTINNNYKHIVELEPLERLLNYTGANVWYNDEELQLLNIIVHTTRNAHYDYKVYTNAMYQDPTNQVDYVLANTEFK